MSLRKNAVFIGSAVGIVGSITGIIAWWVPSSSSWLDHHGFAAWPLALLFLLLFVWAAMGWHQSMQELKSKLVKQELEAGSARKELEAKLVEYTVVPADRQLFNAFKNALPKDSPFMYWLRYESDARLHRDSDVEPLRAFVRTWQRAGHHFVNPELDQAALQLVANGADFLAFQALNSYTAPEHLQTNDDLVYRYFDPNEYIDDHRRREVNEGLNERADKILEAHNKLYMTGSRLGL